jgi:hypothetical protein
MMRPESDFDNPEFVPNVIPITELVPVSID